MPIVDIINIKGQRVFNRNDIVNIEHIYNNWFIVSTDYYHNGFSDTKFLYNVQTKKNINFSPLAYWEAKYTHQGGPGMFTNTFDLFSHMSQQYGGNNRPDDIYRENNALFSKQDIITWEVCVVNFDHMVAVGRYAKAEFYFILKNGDVIKKTE